MRSIIAIFGMTSGKPSPIKDHTLPSPAEEACLDAYRTLPRKYLYPDLSQYAKNGRGRGEWRDGCLETLTTSSQIFSQDFGIETSFNQSSKI